MLELHERNIGQEWYEYGLKQGDDFFIKFMMHWVAFNWYYKFYNEDQEWRQIKKFCDNNIIVLSQFNAFITDEFKVFKVKPIMDGRTGIIGTIQKERYRQITEHQSIPDLIATLYQVRCNLFHGSKSIYSRRDRDLVRASANILEGYLKAYLNV